jgi:uncharacterized protein
MDRSMAHQKISINYIEFKVKDVAQSKRFYQSLGWTFTDFSPAYCEFDSGEIKGGFEQSDCVQSSGGALIVLYSAQLEQSLMAVKEAGATIVQEIFSFPGGRRFHFKDLDGYEIAIWSH